MRVLNNLALITRASFLPLTVVIVLAGLSASFCTHHVFNPFDAALVLVGALLTHMAVNVFNNYFDYRSGIDARTVKTPFSGGVDLLVKGKMSPSAAFITGLTCLVGATVIGLYFLSRVFYPLFPLLVYGLIAIALYSPVLSRIPALSEIVAGSGFGLMGLGVYVTQTAVIDGTGISIFVPITILVGLLLFLNEFPDTEADKAAGRRHLVVLFGKKRAAWIYVAGLVLTYAAIILAVATGVAPLTALVCLVTTPIAYKAAKIAIRNYDRTPELVPALASNVLVILSTILLLGVGFLAGVYV